MDPEFRLADWSRKGSQRGTAVPALPWGLIALVTGRSRSISRPMAAHCSAWPRF
jgi:hypothetical protein